MVILFFTNSITATPIIEEEYTNPEPIVIEEKVELIGELRSICACEGGLDKEGNLVHYGEDGELLRGRVNPLDRGKCQINEKYWGETAEGLELDWLNNESDYSELANHIYNTAGSSPWYLSEFCWSR